MASLCFVFLMSVLFHISLEAGDDPTMDSRFCYNDPNYRCLESSVTDRDVPNPSTECCARGRLSYTRLGSDVCETCSGNAICYSGGNPTCSGSLIGTGIGSIHDCCLINPNGGNYFPSSGVCTACSLFQAQCFSDDGCGEVITELSGTPTNSFISNCCEGPGSSYSFRGQCYPCLVLGWFQQSLIGEESSQNYSVSLGYIKGSGPGFNVVIVTNGAAVKDQDFSLGSNIVTLSPSGQSSLSVSLLQDNVALEEPVENVTLTIIPLSPSDVASNAVFKDELTLSIIDTDELQIGFSEDSFSGAETEGSVTMMLKKSIRIANPVTITVESFTVAGATTAGHPLPPNLPPDDNPLAPNRARLSPEDRRDFNNTSLSVIFQPDERGDKISTVSVSIPVVDDVIDEAIEVFVSTIIDVQASRREVVSTARISTLGSIQDNDAITPSGTPMIGQSFSLLCTVTETDSLQLTISYYWFRGQLPLTTNSGLLTFDTLFLSDAGLYRCEVTVSSDEHQITFNSSYDIDFKSLHIQLRLIISSNCGAYTQSETAVKTSDITNEFSHGVDELCQCGFNTSLISRPFIRCFENSPNHVTYRAVLSSSETISALLIGSFIDRWSKETPSIIVQSAGLRINSTCPVIIANPNSPECPEDLTNRTLIISVNTDNTPLLSVGVVIGIVIGSLALIVALLVAVVLLVALRYRRHKSKTLGISNPPNLDMKPEIVLDELPDHDYDYISVFQEANSKSITQPSTVGDGASEVQIELTPCEAYGPGNPQPSTAGDGASEVQIEQISCDTYEPVTVLPMQDDS